MKGYVKWFDKTKGYGFVRRQDQPDEDIFVHYSNIEMEGYKVLKEDQQVEFELKPAEKGYHAIHVRPIKELETIK